MNPEEREAVLSAVRSLMVSDNQGDVHEVIDRLHRLVGLPEPSGDFLDGWTPEDRVRVGFRQ